MSRCRTVAASWHHTILVSDKTGRFYGFGIGEHGELGHTSGLVKHAAGELTLPFPEGQSLASLQVAAGIQHTLVLSDGAVFSFGNHSMGRLGHNDPMGRVYFPKNDRISTVSCGADYSIAVSARGDTLYFWGVGTLDLCTVDEGKEVFTPTPEPFRICDQLRVPLNILALSCGSRHALALASDGNVYSWGMGGNGRLGHGNALDQRRPRMISALVRAPEERIIDVAAGEAHSLALDVEGNVYAWGSGSYGRLGSGSSMDVYKPLRIEDLSSVFVTSISCSVFHNAAVALVSGGSERALYTWGGGKYGKLGLGDEKNRFTPQCVKMPGSRQVIAAFCGLNHTVALAANGTVWAWGYASAYRCGYESKSGFVAVPTRVETLDNTGIFSLSTERRAEDSGSQRRPANVVAVGQLHSLAVSGGQVFAWGDNAYGQLGTGMQLVSMRPTAVSFAQSDKESKDGSSGLVEYKEEKGEGAGGGEVGPAGQSTSLPGQVATQVTVVSVACGQYHSLALTDTGGMYAWGRNSLGQLGTGDCIQRHTPTLVSALQGTTVGKVVCGCEFSCAVVVDPPCVYTWGDNRLGQLGLGEGAGAQVEFPRVVKLPEAHMYDVAAGRTHTLFLLRWFANYHDPVVECQVRAAVGQPASHASDLLVMKKSAVYACGKGADGQLGFLLDRDAIAWSARRITSFVRPRRASEGDDDLLGDDGKTVEDGSGDQVDADSLLITMIAAGETSSACVAGLPKGETGSDVLYVWGYMPGLTQAPRGFPMAVGWDEPYCFSPEWIQREMGVDQALFDVRFEQVVMARSHGLALIRYNLDNSDHVVFAWGETKYGKLGMGNIPEFIRAKVSSGVQRAHLVAPDQSEGGMSSDSKETEGAAGEESAKSTGGAGNFLHPSIISRLQDRTGNAGNVQMITSFADHCAVVSFTGSVLMWGFAEGGRLGLGASAKSGGVGGTVDAPVAIPQFGGGKSGSEAEGDDIEREDQDKRQQNMRRFDVVPALQPHEEAEFLSKVMEQVKGRSRTFSALYNNTMRLSEDLQGRLDLYHESIAERLRSSQDSPNSVTSLRREMRADVGRQVGSVSSMDLEHLAIMQMRRVIRAYRGEQKRSQLLQASIERRTGAQERYREMQKRVEMYEKLHSNDVRRIQATENPLIDDEDPYWLVINKQLYPREMLKAALSAVEGKTMTQMRDFVREQLKRVLANNDKAIALANEKKIALRQRRIKPWELSPLEVLVTRMNMRPCLMARVFQIYRNDIQKRLRTDARGGISMYEIRTKIKDCMALVFSVYEVKRPEDWRKFRVFLSLVMQKALDDSGHLERFLTFETSSFARMCSEGGVGMDPRYAVESLEWTLCTTLFAQDPMYSRITKLLFQRTMDYVTIHAHDCLDQFEVFKYGRIPREDRASAQPIPPNLTSRSARRAIRAAWLDFMHLRWSVIRLWLGRGDNTSRRSFSQLMQVMRSFLEQVYRPVFVSPLPSGDVFARRIVALLAHTLRMKSRRDHVTHIQRRAFMKQFTVEDELGGDADVGEDEPMSESTQLFDMTMQLVASPNTFRGMLVERYTVPPEWLSSKMAPSSKSGSAPKTPATNRMSAPTGTTGSATGSTSEQASTESSGWSMSKHRWWMSGQAASLLRGLTDDIVDAWKKRRAPDPRLGFVDSYETRQQEAMYRDSLTSRCIYQRRLVHVSGSNAAFLFDHADSLIPEFGNRLVNFFLSPVELREGNKMRMNVRVDPFHVDFAMGQQSCVECGTFHPLEDQSSNDGGGGAGGSGSDEKGQEGLTPEGMVDTRAALARINAPTTMRTKKVMRIIPIEDCCHLWNAISAHTDIQKISTSYATDEAAWKELMHKLNEKRAILMQRNEHERAHHYSKAFNVVQSVKSLKRKAEQFPDAEIQVIFGNPRVSPAVRVDVINVNKLNRAVADVVRGEKARRSVVTLQAEVLDQVNERLKMHWEEQRQWVESLQVTVVNITRPSALPQFIDLTMQSLASSEQRKALARAVREKTAIQISRSVGNIQTYNYDYLVKNEVLVPISGAEGLCCPLSCYRTCSCLAAGDGNIAFLSRLSFVFISGTQQGVFVLRILYSGGGRGGVKLVEQLLSIQALRQRELKDPTKLVEIRFDPLGSDVPVKEEQVFQLRPNGLLLLLRQLPQENTSFGWEDGALVDGIDENLIKRMGLV